MERKASAKTLGLVQLALMGALIFILAFTPFIGYIPLGFTRATIVHIPVIIGSLLLGPKKGAILGAAVSILYMGLFCFSKPDHAEGRTVRMQEYQKSTGQVLENLQSTPEGLSGTEAAARLKQHGPNKLAEGKKVSLAARFFSQLADPMTIILLAAALVSGITAAASGESFAWAPPWFTDADAP